MRFDRRLITHFEWLLPLVALTVGGLGVLTVYSATSDPETTGFSPLALRQLTWLGAGFVGMLLALTFDYRRLDRNAFLVYGLILLMLLAVPFVGRVAGGSRRWIGVGPVTLQPSELMKVALVVVLAHVLAHGREGRLGPRDAVVPLVLTVLPAAAIMAQPDLGTAIVLGIVALTMLVVGGIGLRWFAGIGVTGAVLAPLIAPMLWSRLRAYQQNRILTFLDPERDPFGAGYHVIQSKIAVGSGQMWGKGFLHGTQNHLDFLPEQHTDFIFSVFAEEWGFVGAVALLTLYLVMLLRGLAIASRSRDRFGVLLVCGILAIVFWQAIVNLGMTTGVLPVVGIPLPLFSYGGSSLLTLLIAMGLVMNVSMRRYFF